MLPDTPDYSQPSQWINEDISRGTSTWQLINRKESNSLHVPHVQCTHIYLLSAYRSGYRRNQIIHSIGRSLLTEAWRLETFNIYFSWNLFQGWLNCIQTAWSYYRVTLQQASLIRFIETLRDQSFFLSRAALHTLVSFIPPSGSSAIFTPEDRSGILSRTKVTFRILIFNSLHVPGKCNSMCLWHAPSLVVLTP